MGCHQSERQDVIEGASSRVRGAAGVPACESVVANVLKKSDPILTRYVKRHQGPDVYN